MGKEKKVGELLKTGVESAKSGVEQIRQAKYPLSIKPFFSIFEQKMALY
jgi:hypothetical protein